MKISFVGLGRMGSVMARRLLDAGHDLMIYNRTREKAQELAMAGARVAPNLAEACQHGEAVLTMLADDDALMTITSGQGGLIESLAEGGLHVAMGTHRINTIAALAEKHAEAGQLFVAAPVVGRPAAVISGRLGIIAAGPAAAIERLQPAFEALGRRTFHAGTDAKLASLLKLCNNLVLACAIEAMGEAFSLVEKCQGPPAVFREVLTDGLFACPAYEAYTRMIVEKTWDQVNLTVGLGLKDVNLALETGNAVAVPLPSANVCRDRLLGAIAHGDAQLDWSAMALEQARASALA